jgi:hypothetical protein
MRRIESQPVTAWSVAWAAWLGDTDDRRPTAGTTAKFLDTHEAGREPEPFGGHRD